MLQFHSLIERDYAMTIMALSLAAFFEGRFFDFLGLPRLWREGETTMSLRGRVAWGGV